MYLSSDYEAWIFMNVFFSKLDHETSLGSAGLSICFKRVANSETSKKQPVLITFDQQIFTVTNVVSLLFF